METRVDMIFPKNFVLKLFEEDIDLEELRRNTIKKMLDSIDIDYLRRRVTDKIADKVITNVEKDLQEQLKSFHLNVRTSFMQDCYETFEREFRVGNLWSQIQAIEERLTLLEKRLGKNDE